MKMSLEVGVGSPTVLDEEGVEVSLSIALVAGESIGARCDLRFCRSIMLTAQASRSTGVRLAAWMNGSES